MCLGIFYKGSHLEGCRFLLSVMFYYCEEQGPEELQSSGTGKKKKKGGTDTQHYFIPMASGLIDIVFKDKLKIQYKRRFQGTLNEHHLKGGTSVNKGN